MAKKILLGVLVLLMIFSTAAAKKSESVWRLDGNASDELINFRLMTDAWLNDSRGREPTRQGLEKLRASASAQPSLAALKTLYGKIHEIDPDAQIFLIDLRQESHGFANSIPVSWWIEHNAANAGKRSREVERDELERLNNLRGIETTFEPLGNADKQRLKPVTIIPRFMETERTAAEKIGFTYERFAAADMQFPAPEIVDDFVIFAANLPDNAWLHFHCQAGHGRTTTFLVMYDIIKNPDLTLEDICRRQYLLGGSNLLLEPEGDDWYSRMARDRAEKIRLFYDWFQGTRSEQIGLQWSEWLEIHSNVTEQQPEAENFAKEVLTQVNKEREKVGEPPLRLADDLQQEANIRAREITQLFSHTRPDGSDCFTVMKNRGRTCGENIAAGQSTPEGVMDSWLNSPGHRQNILNPAFRELGVGYAYDENSGYGHYWVQLFRG